MKKGIEYSAVFLRIATKKKERFMEMKKEDDALDLFEELSRDREAQRDRKYQEELNARPVKPLDIVDTGEACVGG